MKDYPGNRLSQENRQAWDTLYGDTPELVWGSEPVGFLREFCGNLHDRLPIGALGLDAAAGEGRNLKTLLDWGMRVVACDASPRALAKLPGEVGARVRPIVSDLYSLPFRSGGFDFVLASDIIETLVDPSRGLCEIGRVMKPGSLLLCNIPGMEDGIANVDMDHLDGSRYIFRNKFFYQFLTEGQATDLLATSGFAVVTSRICTWTENAHPRFRDFEHQHTSRVFLAEKRD